MRYFTRLLADLKNLVANHRPGDKLNRPNLVGSVDVNGQKVSYFQMGLSHKTGPKVILLHGFGGFFMDWPRIMAPIAQHHHVFAIDLIGWGFSDPCGKSQTMDDHEKSVIGFIEKMNLKDVVLVGLSYGGALALGATSARPDLIRQTVVLNPMPPFPIKYMVSKHFRLIFSANRSRIIAWIAQKLLTKLQLKKVCKECLYNGRLLDNFYLDLAFLVTKQPHVYFTFHTYSKEAYNYPWAKLVQKLQNIQVPVCILQGTEDKVFSMKSAEYIQSLTPNSELIEVPKCGHAMVFDQHRVATWTILHKIKELTNNLSLKKIV